MNAASRNQARAVMKSIGSRPNGSMAPYHPTLGKAFSAQPNRLGDIVNEFYTDVGFKFDVTWSDLQRAKYYSFAR